MGEYLRPSTSVKVVVTGPYGAGKTTLLETLSDVHLLSSERSISLDHDSPDHDRAEDLTSLALDVGQMAIEEDLHVQLLATAGHPVFGSLWDILGASLLGALVMIDEQRPDCFDEVVEIIDQLRARPGLPWALVVNKAFPGREHLSARRARHQLRLGDDIRVIAGDARDPEAARAMLVELFLAAQDRLAARDHTDDRELAPTHRTVRETADRA